MMLKNKIFLYLFSFILMSCDTITYEIKPHYSSYFPVNENDSAEFYVLEIQHTSLGSDTLQYFLKEVTKNPYIDGEGDIAFQLHRYWKPDSTEHYQIKDVWSIKKTVSSVEKVEENIRFVKMIFPLDEFSYWDGNLYNQLGEQEYAVNQIHTPYNIFGLTLDTEYEWEVKVWYCSGQTTGWAPGPNFTTAPECPNGGNFYAYGVNPTKARFTWDDSNGPYEFLRIKIRVDSISNPTVSDFIQVGGVGVTYGTFQKDKNGLTPGETYRGQGRTWCDPNGGAYNSLGWGSFGVWTMPTNRIEGGESIANLDVYPNPSRDVFNISFTSETIQDLQVRVLNIVGEEIIVESLQQFIGEYTKQIDLQDNAKGIYFLEIETNQGIINKKLALQ